MSVASANPRPPPQQIPFIALIMGLLRLGVPATPQTLQHQNLIAYSPSYNCLKIPASTEKFLTCTRNDCNTQVRIIAKEFKNLAQLTASFGIDRIRRWSVKNHFEHFISPTDFDNVINHT
jgi:hypothetical protein